MVAPGPPTRQARDVAPSHDPVPGDDAIVDRLRAICLALPETGERPSHGEPAFFVRDKKLVVVLDTHHHGADHLGFWCPAPDGVQAELVAQEPDRFFRPPYVGHRGWLGVRLRADGLAAPDWDEIAEIVHEAFRLVAPTALLSGLDD
jgi:hypothetical protein